MGLFGKKKADTPSEGQSSTPAVSARTHAVEPHDVTAVLVKPRITEKAARLMESNVYTFDIRKGATKHEVRDAIKALYKVTPTEVRIVNRPPREYTSRSRGRRMLEHGRRTAYVALKKGDRIDLV